MIADTTTYRRITHDDISLDEDVTDALAEAQSIVERRTNRFFELEDEMGDPILRTEKLNLHRDGRAYPKATPVMTVVVPTHARIDSGNAVLGGAWTPVSWYGWWTYPMRRPTVSVSYTGGYSSTDMPAEIIRAVVEIARMYLKTRSNITAIPAGATSLKVGDVTVSGTYLSSVTSIIPAQIDALLREWRRPDM